MNTLTIKQLQSEHFKEVIRNIGEAIKYMGEHELCLPSEEPYISLVMKLNDFNGVDFDKVNYIKINWSTLAEYLIDVLLDGKIIDEELESEVNSLREENSYLIGEINDLDQGQNFKLCD